MTHFVYASTLCLHLHSNVKASSQSFQVYWNVPTNACHKYGLNFSELKDYGIIQNDKDVFRGEKITILYDPGLFPAIIDSANRNGGVPQEGNLTAHLIQFQKDLAAAIADPSFSGVGIIDFEEWRPIWRENWGKLDIYRKRSKEIEKKRHPFWTESKIEENAMKRYEKAAFQFMDKTLALAKKIRPFGLWGYYAYPYCFNYTPKNSGRKCTSDVTKDNDRSTWMYETGTSLFPSIYMREKELNEAKRIYMVKERVMEARRVAAKSHKKDIRILPYLAIKYQDTFKFLSKVDLNNGIKVSKETGSDGLILWGATKDTNSAKKCQQMQDYTKKVLKPILKSYKTLNKRNSFV